ncbi:MAG: glycosyltransferase family 4 protein [Phycisphaera sp.]|nr:MAG: glycosyltransferase family 4 protein [Phycisphaera sp.]
MTASADSPNARSGPPTPIRVCIQQPALPAYRVPVFAELARRPGLSVEVLYYEQAKLPNVEAQGFTARPVAMRRLLRRPREVRWVPAQFEAADPARADVAVFEHNSGVLSLIPAMRRAKRNGVGVVLWGHGYSVRETGWSRRLRNWFGRQADAVLLYNHEARERLIDEGMDPKRLFVALNSLDQEPIQRARERWLADPEGLARFRAEQKLDGPVVLFVSRLYAQNRMDLLLHAAARLKDSHPDLIVAIVGDGAERENLEALAQRLGIADRVRMPGAVYGQEELAPWFLSSRVFCYPRFIGLSVLHAFGYGLPVVTNQDMWSHPPEAQSIVHGENGLLVDPGEPGSLAEAIARLVDDEALARRLGESGRQTVLERYTIAGMVDGHEAAIRFAREKALQRAQNR